MMVELKFNIKRLLAEQNMTVTELAKRLQVSRQSLSAIVNNQVKEIKTQTLIDLMLCLQVTPNELLAGWESVLNEPQKDCELENAKLRAKLDQIRELTK